MTSIRVASWNTEGRLTDWGYKTRGTPLRIAKEIVALDADIIFTPEAYCKGRLDRAADRYITSHGYHYSDTPNDDEVKGDDTSCDHVMRFYSKHPIVHEIIRLGIRNASIATVTHGDIRIRIIGVHMHDVSEALRHQMLDSLIPIVMSDRCPTAVMGDWNAMHENAPMAALWRSPSIQWCARLLPHATVRSALRRIGEMANGSVLRRFCGETGYSDADPTSRPTETPKMRHIEWLPSIPLAQLDHIFVSPDVQVDYFAVASDGGSDHRAISATIRI